MAEEKKAQINIELSNEVAQGIYTNFAIISHSSSEFVVDFISHLPAMPKAQVKSRIIMSPENAKRLMITLQENVLKYESEFGKIKNVNGAGSNTLPLFGANPTEA
ncbi:MAG: DUF3467 domain-containing protein [Bacteroidales bacterium]|jgi:hypothetical protein|nr:DUF3467 domain-containing protein [Bacteroidales bacterium]